MTAHYEVRGSVAVITLDNPPVNGMGLTTRAAIADGVERAEGDPAVRALVLTGAGKAFSGGADIKEFGTPKALAEPNLLSLITLVERCSKPVVAAVHTICMGGGLELALGCHYRVAAPGTQVALPEVKLGLLPGAGGTQRLPRALGVEPALNMIVGGEPVEARRLAEVPGQRLFDRLIDGDLLAGAVEFAETVAERRPLPKVRDLVATLPDAEAFFAAARARVAGMSQHFPAPLRCLESVAASVMLPFDDGIRQEREGFAALMATPESRALRHAFFAERAATKIADVPEDTPRREIRRVAVVGAGTMGRGIVMSFLNAGLSVTLLETDAQALDRGVAAIRQSYEAQVGKGRLDADGCVRRLALLTATLQPADLRDADLLIEAVFEDIGVKEAVFRQLDAIARPGAILASNTSTLDVDRIASFTRRPQDVVGLHFFSPAQVMKLLEVVRGRATAKDVLATVMALAKKIRKTAVVSGVCDGFIGNRMIEQYARQAGFLLDEGCSPQQVDRAMETFGFAMGPFRMSDLAGNDISWAIRKRRYIEKPQLKYSASADRLCELGRFGQKTGAGWYDYPAGKREAVPSPIVDELLKAHRATLGVLPRDIGDDEIVHRLVFALVNEAAHLLEEGIAQRASDVDMVYLSGYGFPLWRGGPLCYADSQGLANVVQAMQRFARNPLDDTAFWTPAPLLARLAAEGRRFT
ncbi:3-hydroxyacyl-CoA dehydrogenase NAD-binding domain-containing protein [Roseateles cellulosilyticus]|uniref:3-hydroxyacyl-CoA dehydrogenase NAD-binding domain-containing protein n=1 Tax=Pelomonas cellulosilytica TaxID=2906762 RepID=A0ABS8XV27_9BURK|nr:3-hydroxyacyl-CoA dehydrogenase NAD-binding domain-containing protein [Pelomonas sp. P8]MCE4554671.1 3-hydroxyacyl-CoA dehydrogenase NAD-binding domain-containing protein [Pelomonas sp. P8]